MNEKVRQKLHFVAFLDLLGYKGFFSEKRRDVENFLEVINEALTSTEADTDQHYKNVPDEYKPQIKMFSDNVLIAVKCANNNEIDFLPYLNLVRTVVHIQKTFINKYHLFLRGSIAKGLFYFGEKYVFGEALINAYQMEQAAIYPKIKLDDRYVEKIIEHIRKRSVRHNPLEDILLDVVQKERDGSYFAHYLPTYPWGKDSNGDFCISSIFAEDHSAGEDFLNDRSIRTCETIYAHKVALLEKIHDYGSYTELFSQKDIDARRRVILKYMWSLDYHNQVCKLWGLNKLMIRCNIKTDSRTLQPVVEVLEG